MKTLIHSYTIYISIRLFSFFRRSADALNRTAATTPTCTSAAKAGLARCHHRSRQGLLADLISSSGQNLASKARISSGCTFLARRILRDDAVPEHHSVRIRGTMCVSGDSPATLIFVPTVTHRLELIRRLTTADEYYSLLPPPTRAHLNPVTLDRSQVSPASIEVPQETSSATATYTTQRKGIQHE